jgi:hypothetical protein
VRFTPEGAVFTDGFIRVPNQPEAMGLGRGMTLDFTFRADRVDGMPVLLSHGAWMVDGWFVQILNGALIVRTPGGDAEGPAIEPGKWYTVRFVFDGTFLHLAVNGEWVYQGTAVVRPVPAERDLIIGQYDTQETSYAFHGAIREVGITPDAFLDNGAP